MNLVILGGLGMEHHPQPTPLYHECVQSLQEQMQDTLRLITQQFSCKYIEMCRLMAQKHFWEGRVLRNQGHPGRFLVVVPGTHIFAHAHHFVFFGVIPTELAAAISVVIVAVILTRATSCLSTVVD